MRFQTVNREEMKNISLLESDLAQQGKQAACECRKPFAWHVLSSFQPVNYRKILTKQQDCSESDLSDQVSHRFEHASEIVGARALRRTLVCFSNEY